uniref:Uncharacterized protein n=1 Tax=Caenorhabditis japonica TaxID=281687 RepID=A0A8R1DPC1_CAEJA
MHPPHMTHMWAHSKQAIAAIYLLTIKNYVAPPCKEIPPLLDNNLELTVQMYACTVVDFVVGCLSLMVAIKFANAQFGLARNVVARNRAPRPFPTSEDVACLFEMPSHITGLPSYEEALRMQAPAYCSLGDMPEAVQVGESSETRETTF